MAVGESAVTGRGASNAFVEKIPRFRSNFVGGEDEDEGEERFI